MAHLTKWRSDSVCSAPLSVSMSVRQYLWQHTWKFNLDITSHTGQSSSLVWGTLSAVLNLLFNLVKTSVLLLSNPLPPRLMVAQSNAEWTTQKLMQSNIIPYNHEMAVSQLAAEIASKSLLRNSSNLLKESVLFNINIIQKKTWSISPKFGGLGQLLPSSPVNPWHLCCLWLQTEATVGYLAFQILTLKTECIDMKGVLVYGISKKIPSVGGCIQYTTPPSACN